MRKIVFAFLFLITFSCFAALPNCYRISHEPSQRICLNKQIKDQQKEMKRLERLIESSPHIPQRDKQLLRKDQRGWEAQELSVCGHDPYCTNSELEQRINDLSAYLTSFNNRGE